MERHFLLIHGGSHGGWCWQPLMQQLELGGASASAPDLPGHGLDSTPRRTVDRSRYLDFIDDWFELNDIQDLILVGHSLAGILLPHIADRHADRLSEVIFLAAMVCEHGQRPIDLIPKKRRQSYFDIAEQSDENAILWPYEMARAIFFSDLNDQQSRWAYRQLTPQPFQVYLDPVPQTDIEIPIRYLACTEDRCLPRRLCEDSASRLGVEMELIDSGHDVMLSQPESLAQELLRS